MRGGWLVLALCGCGRLDFIESDPPHAGYTYRKPITVPASKVTAALASFPLALRITDPDLRTRAGGGKLVTGNDFAFLDQDGATALPFEVDAPIGDSDTLVAWVQLPALAPSVDTQLYLAFGDAGVTTSQATPAQVWSNGFVGVWHFSEGSYTGAAGEVADATGAHAGAINGAVTAKSDGRLGRAATFGGNCSEIVIPQSAALQPPSVTVSAWARETDLGTSPTDRIATIVAQDYWRMQGTGSQGYYLEIYRTLTQPVATFYAANGPTYAHAYSLLNEPNAGWYYSAGMYDQTTGTSSIYVDGALQGTQSMTGPIAYVDRPVQIGCTTGGWWKGDIDEVRISNVVRAPEWIAAEYANQSDPAGFATIGATELAP